jgi:hypothetical protein
VEGRVEKTRWSHIPITFSEEDVRLQGFPHNDALVIEANIASWTLGKLLVDNGSSADIIFADAFDKMGLNRDLLQPPDTPLYGFGGHVIHALGKVVLPVSFGTVQNARTEYLSFDVVEMYYPYNGILGRGFLNKFEVVIHQNPGDARGHHNLGSSKRRPQSRKRPHPGLAKRACPRRSSREQ